MNQEVIEFIMRVILLICSLYLGTYRYLNKQYLLGSIDATVAIINIMGVARYMFR